MRYLRNNTATRLTVGPFLNKTDGVTPETALTVTACRLTLMVDTGGVPTIALNAPATASGGANDMVHVSGDLAGFFDLELAAVNVNYFGRAMLAITNAAVHCPVFHELMIVPASIYDALILGTDILNVNVDEVAGVTQSPGDIIDAINGGLTATLAKLPTALGANGNMKSDVRDWIAAPVATPTVNGVPEVEVTQWAGAAVATPTNPGVPEVDVTHSNGAPVITAGGIDANVVSWAGQTVPTPTVNGVPEVDVTHAGGVPNTTAGAVDAHTKTMATDSVNAAAISAPAANKIASAVLAADNAGVTVGAQLQHLDADVSSVASGGGTVDAHVLSMAPDVVNASALSATAANEIAAALLATTNAGATVGAQLAHLDEDISTGGTAPTAQQNANTLLATANGTETVAEQLAHLDEDVSDVGGGTGGAAAQVDNADIADERVFRLSRRHDGVLAANGTCRMREGEQFPVWIDASPFTGNGFLDNASDPVSSAAGLDINSAGVNRELVVLWLDAVTAGEYTVQVKAHPRASDAVLCELAVAVAE